MKAPKVTVSTMLDIASAPPASVPLSEISPFPQRHSEQRPWGSFTILDEGAGYKIKRILVLPQHRLSLQMHYHRSEHWIVVSGTALVTCDGHETLLNCNQSTYVPPCTKHRLENPGLIPLVVIEVQNGQYLGEDDIVRFHDDYARTPQG